jgi:hypothetical protein
LDTRTDTTLYQELLGSLNHIAVFSRPDIANALSKLSAFLQDPTETHLRAARRVLRYLLQTRNLSLCYGGASFLYLMGYNDSDWGGDLNDRKSTTGYVFTLNGGPVSWTARKQTTVATSTMEAEYMAISDASREAIAKSQLLDELRLKIPTPMLFCDNQGALNISEDPTNYQRAKHIDIRYHFVSHALMDLKNLYWLYPWRCKSCGYSHQSSECTISSELSSESKSRVKLKPAYLATYLVVRYWICFYL